MPEYLTVTLAAPIAAMGELAIGERRGSWDRPGRSAVLGLLAGCLGLDRADEAAHLALERALGLGLRVEWTGGLLADYHTAQVPRRGRRYATRAEEVAAPALNTVLSRRDYRCDVLAFAAIWLASPARWSLSALAEACRRPHFAPYFGRKSCPLMLPLAPDICEAEDAVAALAACAAAELARGTAPPRPPRAGPPVVALDAALAADRALRVEMRRDRLVSRRRWQFGLREEAVLKGPP